jgi:hypothetical protein
MGIVSAIEDRGKSPDTAARSNSRPLISNGFILSSPDSVQTSASAMVVRAFAIRTVLLSNDFREIRPALLRKRREGFFRFGACKSFYVTAGTPLPDSSTLNFGVIDLPPKFAASRCASLGTPSRLKFRMRSINLFACEAHL